MGEGKVKVVVVLGPTGSGKSELAERLAAAMGAEIVNADSMQVYRGMDIGTAKPSPAAVARIPHHLLDIVPPDVNYSAARFRRDAAVAISEIDRRGGKPILVGGTGLYIRALLQGLVDAPSCDDGFRRRLEGVAGGELLRRLAEVDPETAARLHPNDRVRIVRALEVFHQTGRPMSAVRTEHGFSGAFYETLKIGIRVGREELYRRIERRVDGMLEAGLVEEVRSLLAAGYDRKCKSMRAIGYKEIAAYLSGEVTLNEAVSLIKRDTRRYAKRQMTWFNRDDEIYWLEYPESFDSILGHVIEFFA